MLNLSFHLCYCPRDFSIYQLRSSFHPTLGDVVLNILASSTSLVMFSVKQVQATLGFIMSVLLWPCCNWCSVDKFGLPTSILIHRELAITGPQQNIHNEGKGYLDLLYREHHK